MVQNESNQGRMKSEPRSKTQVDPIPLHLFELSLEERRLRLRELASAAAAYAAQFNEAGVAECFTRIAKRWNQLADDLAPDQP